MADITLFKVDLSDSTFVAPFGRQVFADHVDVEGEEDESGGRGKLLLVGALGALVAVGGLAFVLVRRFRGGDDDVEESEWGDDDWERETTFEFGETVDDPEGDFRTSDDDRTDDESRSDYEADDEPRRSGAVAAVVGLLFLLVVTALVKRRRTAPDFDTTDEYRREPPTAVR